MGQPGWSWGGCPQSGDPQHSPGCPQPARRCRSPVLQLPLLPSRRRGRAPAPPPGLLGTRGGRLVSTKVLSKPPATSHPPFPIFLGTNFLKKHGAGHRCSAHLHLTPPSKLYARAQPFCTGLGAGCRPQGPWRRPQRRPQRAQHQLSHQPVLAGTPFPRAGCLQAAPFHIGDFFFPLYRHPGRL